MLVLTGRHVCWRLGVGVDGSTCVLEGGCWSSRIEMAANLRERFTYQLDIVVVSN